MDDINCVPEGPPTIWVCISETYRILSKYFAGEYDMLSFNQLHIRGVVNPPTILDAIGISIIFILFYFVYIIFHSTIPKILSRYCDNITEELEIKIASNGVTIFEKVIKVVAIIYVLYIESDCPITRRFSIVKSGTIKQHSLLSYIVNLSVISGYIFKLFAIAFLSTNKSRILILIIHHIVAIYVGGVSLLFNQ